MAQPSARGVHATWLSLAPLWVWQSISHWWPERAGLVEIMNPLPYKPFVLSWLFLVHEMRLPSCFCLGFPELKTWCATCAWSGGAGAGASMECGCAGLRWEWVQACPGLWAELPAQQLVGLPISKGENSWGAEKHSKCELSRRRKALT